MEDQCFKLEFEMCKFNMPQSLEEFKQFCQSYTDENVYKILHIISHLLQTKEQLEGAVEDIFHNAAKENVICTLFFFSKKLVLIFLCQNKTWS